MKSVKPGNRISQVEVTNVSQHGFWLYILDKEVFLSFENFPWFRDVAIGHLLNVQLPHTDHLYWPDLDVDLSVESLYHPERFPLVARAMPDKTQTISTPAGDRANRPGGTRRSKHSL